MATMRVVAAAVCLVVPLCCSTTVASSTTPRGKLLYILMDGFRWDYVTRVPPGELLGFTQFLKEGGRAQWTDPLFPSLSYPTWTTLVTGQYAETHGIVGNYFYDPEDKDVFSLFDSNATGKSKWWKSEPVWTTAEKAGLRTAQFLWARCDVPIDGVTTHFCEPFTKIPGKEIFLKNINRALDKLSEGYDLVQVYTEHTDHAGHNTGPDSPETHRAVRELDQVLQYLLTQLAARRLTDLVNVVIVSDHGMTGTAPGTIQRHELDHYLNTSLVDHIADRGAFFNIKVPPHNVDQVFQQVSQIPGVRAYRREDVPERFHFRHHKYIHEIILQADMGHFLLASRSEKQLPPSSDYVYYGAHGYSPDYMDMKGIFFAKGPAFKCGWTLSGMHVVDVYQVLTHVLGVTPQPHNGTWDHVSPALATHSRDGCPASTAPSALRPCSFLLPLALILFLILVARVV